MKWPVHAAQTTWDSPLGLMRLVATPLGLAGLWFHDQRHLPGAPWFERWNDQTHLPVLQEARRQLAAFFEDRLQPFQLPLDLTSGTPFQQEVWTALQAIQPGQTRSYGEIAERIGRPAAVRAVGAAVGRNPLSIVVPCHRVVGANGSLTGYAGGIERKRTLLDREMRSP